jgi:hypothetical protein
VQYVGQRDIKIFTGQIVTVTEALKNGIGRGGHEKPNKFLINVTPIHRFFEKNQIK